MPRPGGTITIRNYRPDQPIDWNDLGFAEWRQSNMRRFGRRSYQQIAKAMFRAKGESPLSGTALAMWNTTVLALGQMLAADSHHFSYPRFLAACETGNIETR